MTSSDVKKLPPKKLAAIGIGVAVLAAVLLASVLLNGRLKATTMSLDRLEGNVAVSNDKGAQVTPKDALRLYSGYGVETRSSSYAWISLDRVKLVKMDQKSEISIQKEGKHLEIEVSSGSLFFNVTEPLADDESMDIRTSTMVLGIRGTCGWVVSHGDRGAQVFLLEGTVTAQATETGDRVQVHAGEMAQVTVSEEGETTIEVLPFTEELIAPFVLSELEADPALSAAILAASGLDVLDPPDPLDPAQQLRAEYIDIINSRPILDAYAADGTVHTVAGTMYASEGLSYAAIVDLDGNGTDELILVTQHGPWSLTKLEVYGESQGHAVLYGETALNSRFKEDHGWDSDHAPSRLHLAERDGDGHIYAVVTYGIQDVQATYVYTIENDELILAEHEGYSGFVGDRYIANWDLTDSQDICPPLPADIQMKNALSACLDTYAQPADYYFAKLVDTDLYALYGDGSLEKCSWNGTSIERTYLEDGIIYAALMDMDQDGSEELILGEGPIGPVVAYSWKGTSCERTLLHEATLMYEGFYRDTVTGDIYLCSVDRRSIGLGEDLSFDSLTDHLGYSFDTEAILGYDLDSALEYLTPAELEEAYALISEAWEEYDRELERFVSIEALDLSGDSFRSFERIWYTVDEVRRQLTER